MKKTILFIFVLIAQNAFAADRGFIIPGSKPGAVSGLVSVADGDTFTTRTLPDRSVYCRYRSVFAADWGLSTTITCPFLNIANCPTGNQAGAAEAGIDASSGGDDAIAFIANEQVGAAPNSGFYLYRMTVSTISGGTNSAVVECFDTTLFGNFNTVTAANPFNFLELSNDSAAELNARIVITKNDGTFLSRTNVSIPAGQQKDISIHDIAGAANTFGRITVAHNGSLHALRASLTKYTSSFVITASTPFATRANEQ